MKIAIHQRPGSFSDKWIEYCETNNITYKLVCCYDSDIVSQLEDCNGLMWHWHHSPSYPDYLFARQLTYSLEAKGIKVFPDSRTVWHFDDKLGQKYLLEVLDLPLVPTYVFYNKEQALQWTEETQFPKVFKTRNGAGAKNVKLIKSKKHAKQLIKKSFGSGIPSYDKLGELKESIWKLKRDKNMTALARVGKYILMYPLPAKHQIKHLIEKDYVLFQDFVADNKYDIRIIVIGSNAFAIKRLIRANDFRASGSGLIFYEHDQFPISLIAGAFKISRKIKTQSLALDFICDDNGHFLIVEISYAFASKGYLACPGYWDENLVFHQQKFHPEFFMIEDFLDTLK